MTGKPGENEELLSEPLAASWERETVTFVKQIHPHPPCMPHCMMVFTLRETLVFGTVCVVYLDEAEGKERGGMLTGVLPLAPPVINHGRERAVVGGGVTCRTAFTNLPIIYSTILRCKVLWMITFGYQCL